MEIVKEKPSDQQLVFTESNLGNYTFITLIKNNKYYLNYKYFHGLNNNRCMVATYQPEKV